MTDTHQLLIFWGIVSFLLTICAGCASVSGDLPDSLTARVVVLICCLLWPIALPFLVIRAFIWAVIRILYESS